MKPAYLFVLNQFCINKAKYFVEKNPETLVVVFNSIIYDKLKSAGVQCRVAHDYISRMEENELYEKACREAADQVHILANELSDNLKLFFDCLQFNYFSERVKRIYIEQYNRLLIDKLKPDSALIFNYPDVRTTTLKRVILNYNIVLKLLPLSFTDKIKDFGGHMLPHLGFEPNHYQRIYKLFPFLAPFFKKKFYLLVKGGDSPSVIVGFVQYRNELSAIKKIVKSHGSKKVWVLLDKNLKRRFKKSKLFDKLSFEKVYFTNVNKAAAQDANDLSSSLFAYFEVYKKNLVAAKKFFDLPMLTIPAFFAVDEAEFITRIWMSQALAKNLDISATIPGITQLHYQGVFAELGEKKFTSKVNSNKLFLATDQIKQTFLDHLANRANESIEVSGFDELISLVNFVSNNQLAEKLKRKYNVAPNDFVVLFTTQQHNYSFAYVRTVAKALSEIEEKSCKLLVKPHPVEWRWLYKLISFFTNKWPTTVVDKGNLYELIKMANVVVTHSSFTALEALHLGKPVIFLDFHHYKKRSQVYNRKDVQVVDTTEGLKNAIRNFF